MLAVAAVSAHPSPASAQPPAGDTLRIGLVAPDSAARTPGVQSAARGVRLGVEEAAHSASLFGRAVVLVEGTDADRLIDQHVSALLGGFADAECRALSDAAARRGVIFVNLGCDADALRGEACRPTTFHVAPSAAMRADAVRQAGIAGGTAVAWDARLDRFGADQLNQRYHARFGGDMDAAAWGGWFAVKLLFESSLRARSTSPDALLRFLGTASAQWDGHKGRPLSFRTWDRQLREPLYVTGPTSPDPVEVPRAQPGIEESTRDLLDRLGTPESQTKCTIDR